MADPGRLQCCVPFCNRTIGIDAADKAWREYICGYHWRGIPKAKRDYYKKARRRFEQYPSSARAAKCARLWVACKDAAHGQPELDIRKR